MSEKQFCKRWTPQRKAKYVSYRLVGMHPEWAAFWAMVNRRVHGTEIYSASDVDHLMENDGYYQRAWSKPMAGVDRLDNLPPKWVFDGLEESK